MLCQCQTTRTEDTKTELNVEVENIMAGSCVLSQPILGDKGENNGIKTIWQGNGGVGYFFNKNVLPWIPSLGP